MSPARLLLILLLTIASHYCKAQTDAASQSLQQVSKKYIQQVDSKIDKCNYRITGKTEKTLTKLSRWENKIKPLLQKANPAAAERLFGEGKPTFTSLLQKFKEGKSVTENYKARYDEYRDKLSTSLKYLEDQKKELDAKLITPVHKANQKLAELEDNTQQQEAVEAFIKERKKQLFDEAIKYIGKSKYLAKINKESYYYVETIKNYKQLFNDKPKAEETALNILNKIPAFKKFMQENSMLARLFPSASGGSSTPNLAGLQTRAGVNALIQNQIAAGGPNAREQVMQNIQNAQAQFNQVKEKVMRSGAANSDAEMPDFKPNQTKTQTFKQRLEFGSNLQFAKNNGLVPTTADIGLSLGYKLNDKGIIGLGASYKMGMGSIQRIAISHQGIGLRSFVDWKLKKQFYITGGYEMNYNAAFKNIEQLRSFNDWQNAGLVGLSKKINVKSKWVKGTKLQLMYDLLARQHAPVSQPVIFRVGYNF
jgi:hypothetical protein